jgi:hypothetical protein
MAGFRDIAVSCLQPERSRALSEINPPRGLNDAQLPFLQAEIGLAMYPVAGLDHPQEETSVP